MTRSATLLAVPKPNHTAKIGARMMRGIAFIALTYGSSRALAIGLSASHSPPDHLPKALLTAAHWQALAGDAATARRHLDEAQQIAERGPMPLHLADVHLHRARLFRDKAARDRARELIKQHGYGRRHEELGHALLAAQAW